VLLAVVHGTSVWCTLVSVHENIVAKWRCGAIVSTQSKFSLRDPDAPNGDGNRIDVLRMGAMCLRCSNKVSLDMELDSCTIALPSTKLSIMFVLDVLYLAATMFRTYLVLGYVWQAIRIVVGLWMQNTTLNFIITWHTHKDREVLQQHCCVSRDPLSLGQY
jgi:hypothetical protein